MNVRRSFSIAFLKFWVVACPNAPELTSKTGEQSSSSWVLRLNLSLMSIQISSNKSINWNTYQFDHPLESSNSSEEYSIIFLYTDRYAYYYLGWVACRCLDSLLVHNLLSHCLYLKPWIAWIFALQTRLHRNLCCYSVNRGQLWNSFETLKTVIHFLAWEPDK